MEKRIRVKYGLTALRLPIRDWTSAATLPHHRPLNTKFRPFSCAARTPAAAQTPKLFAETALGEEIPITEGDLYRYTRHRWLQNEKDELAARYLKFSLPGLIEAAVGACKGAKYCTKVLKCSEGLFNKAFIMTMNNGTEVFAKLPNPNAGPAQSTTASEVATRQMLRDLFNIPVPRVIAWSCDATSNSVEAEYILEEKAPGVRLGSLWQSMPWENKLAIVDQVVDFDSSLSSVSFKTHGCVYFKEDLQRLGGVSETIQLSSSQDHPNLGRYVMGPLTKGELWISGRAQMNLDRGPWKNSHDYVCALGANEVSWIQQNAKPQMNYYRVKKGPEVPEDAFEVLAKHEKVAPVLVPASNDISATANVLWHPDLHLDNIFVDPHSHKITAIIDWQSASVAPLFFQSHVHRAFRHYKPVQEGWVFPEKPDNFDALSPEEQKRIDQDLESEMIHKYFEVQTMERAPAHWNVLQQKTVPILRKPVWLVTGVWENRDLFFLRDSLISIVAQWNDIFGDSSSCPIDFSTEELELHAKEEENIKGVGEALSLFRDKGLLPAHGMVAPEDYESAIENCHKFKEVFLNSAENDTERELYNKLWPYQDVPE